MFEPGEIRPRAAAAGPAEHAAQPRQAPSLPATAARGRVRASPKARRLAEKLGIELAAVPASGPDGLVTEADVERAAQKADEAGASAAGEWKGRAVRERRRLAAKARGEGLDPEDFGAGTFTVSNLGAFGIRAGTPVVNLPEAMLAFVGAVEDRPVVRDGAIMARPTVTLSIAYDHRVADGAAAARVTARIRACSRTPRPGRRFRKRAKPRRRRPGDDP